ncbi:MAG TPA: SH3 domain-containing protein [Clostridia bacterium]|nr:SH3 domain-containing protein [Clostridia bacterium]
MSIDIGHAVMDESGKTVGLTSGDQTGKEITVAKWYAKNKAGRTWKYYLECTDPAMAERAAQYMEQICADSSFGYTQDKVRRWSGYHAIVANGGAITGAQGDFDCSTLIFSCYILAGLEIEPDGYTGNLRAKFLASDKFKSYADASHISSDALATRGGIYLRDGHVLMALEDGSGAVPATTEKVIGRIIVDEIKKWCNVRSGPSLEHTIIGRANKNAVYDMYGVEEDWYRINYNGSVGYIFGDLASEILEGNV